ncbi:VOC family protein [Glaciecola sp. XM2]|uniref:VOC family protein n=1 Tax=Glaciecola sp. XM2 TaxID=1914931 RepID=UPI001BDE37B1|nr:VOC family protein [Glaciecola sp. XM2]MBT1449958.1 VOC family protein [Glaciecola sp. XM2]
MTDTIHHQIHYLEIPTKDIDASKVFFAEVFGWEFVDYGPEYTCFTGQQIEGGFFLSSHSMHSESGSALVVIYSDDLEASLQQVESAGGVIVKPIFSFPGGSRFHFVDTAGNEFAVWH